MLGAFCLSHATSSVYMQSQEYASDAIRFSSVVAKQSVHLCVYTLVGQLYMLGVQYAY